MIERGGNMNIKQDKLIKAWDNLQKIAEIKPIQNKVEYTKAAALLDELIDQTAGDENHHLADLIEVVGLLISKYEENHIKIPPASPVAILKHLMTEHNLTQADLPEIGSQGVISEILHGKRVLNLRQINALANRFSIDPSVFISGAMH